jgi:hypothetical protein
MERRPAEQLRQLSEPVVGAIDQDEEFWRAVS